MALNKESHRGIEDEMLLLEAEIPGFGGFFVEQPEKTLVAYVQDMGNAAEVEAMLRRRSHSSLKHIFNSLPDPSKIEVRKGNFAFSTLLDWQERVAQEAGDAFTFLDADEAFNRLTIEVLSSDAEREIEAIARAIGIPQEGYAIRIVEALPSTYPNLVDYHVQPVGGVAIQAYPGADCSLGYNVRGYSDLGGLFSPDSMYFVTAAHCYNQPSLTTGQMGADVGQPMLSAAAPDFTVGNIVYNQPWNETGPLCGGFTYCAREDVMVVKYNRDRLGEFKLAYPTGNNPPFFPYSTTWDVAGFIGAWVGGDVFKTGIATGRTFGTVSATCATQTMSVGALGSLRLTCAHRSDNEANYGDSGGPVFATGYGYGYVYGIVSGGAPGLLVFTGGNLLQSRIPWLFQPL